METQDLMLWPLTTQFRGIQSQPSRGNVFSTGGNSSPNFAAALMDGDPELGRWGRVDDYTLRGAKVRNTAWVNCDTLARLSREALSAPGL